MIPVDPQTIIGAIYSAVVTIQQKVEQVKANKSACHRLAERVAIINETVSSLTPDKVIDFQLALQAINKTLQDAILLMIKFSDVSFFLTKAWKANAEEQALADINKKLTESLRQITFGVATQTMHSVQKLLDKETREKEDKQDKEADQNDNAILELCQQELIEMQEIKKDMAEIKTEEQKIEKSISELKNLAIEQTEKLAMLDELKNKLATLEEEKEKWAILNRQMTALTEQLKNPPVKEIKVSILSNQKRIDLQALTFKRRIENKGNKQVWKGAYHQNKVLIECIECQADSDEFKALEREVKILAKLSSAPSIVNFHGACIEKGRISAVYDYDRRSKSLRKLLDEIYQTSIQSNDNTQIKKTDLFRLRRKLKIAENIAIGINFLKTEDFIHRNITTSTVLVDEHDYTKISGFELTKLQPQDADELGIHSVSLDNNNAINKFSFVEWASPELKHESLQNQVITHKSDIFSFGGILWEIFTGQKAPVVIPYDNMSAIFKSISSEQLATIPPEIINLIKDCWSLKPENRPEPSTIINKLSTLKKKISSDEHYNEADAYSRAGLTESALERYQRAAKDDTHYKAKTHVAGFMLRGFGSAQDKEEAIKTLKKNAEDPDKRHAYAMKELVTHYEKYQDGNNLKEALFWCDKLIARYGEAEPGQISGSEMSRQKMRSIELNKKLVSAYEKQGNIESLQQAVTSCEQWIKRYKDYSDKPSTDEIARQESKLQQLKQQLQVLKSAQDSQKSFGW